MDLDTKITAVRITDAALSTQQLRGRTFQIIRGVLMPDQFAAIMVPPYQRVAMDNAKHDEIMAALSPGGIGIPDDLLLCVRGTDFVNVGSGAFVVNTGELWLLYGHQRVYGAWDLISQGSPTAPFGVKIILGTTLEEEVEFFHQVNRLQTKVSPHVLLRNRGDNAAIAALREAAKADGTKFPQVQWDQLKQTGDQITAHMLYEVAVLLHGRSRPGDHEELLESLVAVSSEIGTELLVENVTTFFEALRKIFGSESLSRFMYRADVLRAVAILFGGHVEFWKANNQKRLFVRAPAISKLGGIRLNVVERELATSAGTTNLLRELIRQYNLGRTAGLLRQRQW